MEGSLGSRAVRGGSHRAPQDDTLRFIVSAVLTLAVVGAGLWFVVSRTGGPGGGGGGGDAPTPEFSFELGRVGGSSVGEQAEEADLRRVAEAVRETLDRMYVAGFVDPARWEGGTFPEVLDAFADGTRQQAQRDLPLLSLGQDATADESIQPKVGRLHMRFLLDLDGEPTAAIASTSFSGGGTLHSGGPVAVRHDGTYYLRPEEGRWLIVAYDVEGSVQPGSVPTAEGGATS